ncbi:MAG: hypothetical protein V7750_18990 [Sneathiella sp.]
MIIDDVKISDLPDSSEEIFTVFEKRLRDVVEHARTEDRQNENCVGSFLSDRNYVSSILAFWGEHSLNIDAPDISEISDVDFNRLFSQFFANINSKLHAS